MHGRLALLTIAILCVGVWEFRKAASQDTNTADSDSCNQKLHKKTIAPDRYPFARCSDHSPAIYYDSNTPPKPGNERWMIFLEGGGVCSNQSQCVDRYRDQPYLMSSNVSDVYGDSLCGTDVFNATDQLNPFKDFHHILLPYCTQDVYIGSNTGPLRDSSIVFDTNNPGNFSHSGSFVFRAMIDTLSPQLLSAKEIILGGTSAGALGSLNQARWMQEQFPQADIKLLLDSGWIIDYKAIGRGMLFTKFAQQSSNLSAHAACQVMHEGLPCCLSPVCMLENTEVGVPAKIPILVITSSYDLFMLQIAVASSPPIPRQEYFDLIADYGGAMNQTLNAARSRNGTSLIQTRCSQHTYIVSSTLWRSERLRRNGSFAPRPVAGGVINFRHSINDTVWDLYKLRQANGTAGPNMQSLISSWYTASLMGVEFNISDACGQFLCNSNCPDGLALGGIDSSFSSGLQIFVVTVAVLIAVGTFLIKVALKMQLLLIHRSMKKLLSEADKNLSDCLPESSDVSVACYNLSYSLTIPIAVKDDDEEEDDMVTEANTDERTRRNTYLKMDKTTDFVDGVSRPEVHGNGLTRSASLPSPVTSRPVTPKRFFSVMEGSHTKKRPARQTEIKVIVNGVTAYFNSGSMVAIMGPSGCGKTTLMDLLTGRRAGDIEGEVLVNGHPLDDVHSWYHRNTGYVRQLATPYYDELTVRENLLYSALLRLPSSHTRAELFEQMKMVINEVGLSEIEDRRVGGSTGGGISGGEKRRLCVAMQLMGMPNIVFLDEPTSGLDSTAAKDLLNVLHIIAQGNRLVVLSIHQPRPEIYHLFAKILFLCNGQVAFYGSPEKAIKFFMDAVENRNPESFQKLASEKYNPADLILDALNDEHNQECILEHYKLSPEPTKIMNRVKAAKIRHETQSVLGSAQTRSFWSALLSLEGRMRRQSWGQAIYLPLVFFFYGLGVGIAYFQAEKGFLILAAFNLLTNISFLFVSPALTNVILGRCLHIFEMEHGDGVMRVSHFVLHAFIHMTAITMIPFAVLTALIFYMVSTVGATFTDFLLILLVNLTANGTDVAIVILICVTIPTYATPIAHVVCAYVTFFEGFLYPVPDIHEAIRDVERQEIHIRQQTICETRQHHW